METLINLVNAFLLGAIGGMIVLVPIGIFVMRKIAKGIDKPVKGLK